MLVENDPHGTHNKSKGVLAVYATQRRLNEIRARKLVLVNPMPIEEKSLELYDHVRTRRIDRRKDITSVSLARKVLELDLDCENPSGYSYLALAMSEVDKRKSKAEDHRHKCFKASEYLKRAESLQEQFSENERKSFKFVSDLVNAKIANQPIPGDY